jgi:hypothetical protein
MGLRPGRIKDMVEEAISSESATRCHTTLDNSAERWPAPVCRDYWNLPRVARLWAQMAVRMGVLVFDSYPRRLSDPPPAHARAR